MMSSGHGGPSTGSNRARICSNFDHQSPRCRRRAVSRPRRAITSALTDRPKSPAVDVEAGRVGQRTEVAGHTPAKQCKRYASVTTSSPTLITPSLRMSALIPARCASSRMIPGRVIDWRCRHGSQSSTP